MDKSSLGVHQIELSVELGPGLAHGRRVGEGADGALNLGQVAAGNDGGRLRKTAQVMGSNHGTMGQFHEKKI